MIISSNVKGYNLPLTALENTEAQRNAGEKPYTKAQKEELRASVLTPLSRILGEG